MKHKILATQTTDSVYQLCTADTSCRIVGLFSYVKNRLVLSSSPPSPTNNHHKLASQHNLVDDRNFQSLRPRTWGVELRAPENLKDICQKLNKSKRFCLLFFSGSGDYGQMPKHIEQIVFKKLEEHYVDIAFFNRGPSKDMIPESFRLNLDHDGYLSVHFTEIRANIIKEDSSEKAKIYMSGKMPNNGFDQMHQDIQSKPIPTDRKK